MPDLTGLTTRDAVHWLQEHGVDVRLYGRGTVRKQSPQPGQPLPSTAMLTGEARD
jgi:beta-lactam-binding protein with PASTA domain